MELLPASFLCPWDFPDKNTGVCCHFLLQGIFPNQGLNLNLSLLCLLGSHIPMYHIYMNHIIFVHSSSISINGHLACFPVLVTVNDAALNIKGVDLFNIVVSFPVASYPGVGLLDHMVTLFKEPPYCFP